MRELYNAILANMKAEDADLRYESLAETFEDEIMNDDEPYDKKGYFMMKAILENNLSDFLIAVCGWDADSLMAKAFLMKDTKGVIHLDNKPIEAGLILVYVNGDEHYFACEIDPDTFELVRIDQRLKDKAVPGGSHAEIYVSINGHRFLVEPKQKIDDIENNVVFWYDPEKFRII